MLKFADSTHTLIVTSYLLQPVKFPAASESNAIANIFVFSADEYRTRFNSPLNTGAATQRPLA
jgi:hypothetical protein